MINLKAPVSASLFGVLFCTLVSAQVTQRVSVGWKGLQPNSASRYPSISADGRFVAFDSLASNLVYVDTNVTMDIFVRDRQTGTTEVVSVASDGTQGNEMSSSPSISADGQYIAFASGADNLVSGDTNWATDVFVRDRQHGLTVRMSLSSSGVQGYLGSGSPSISADGRYVAFESRDSNLVPGDTNSSTDVFVRDRWMWTTERVSVSSGGAEGNGYSTDASISADGRYVAFVSWASNLVAGDTNGWPDVFVRDRQSGTTERVSVGTGGTEGNGSCFAKPSISADGRFVAFHCISSNLVPGDTNGWGDSFVRDRQTGTTERVSVASGGIEVNGPSGPYGISADGRYVAFGSQADGCVPGDTNSVSDIFVHDRHSHLTERVSTDPGGAEGNGESWFASISADGRHVAFHSAASNLVSGDSNSFLDVFVGEVDAPGFSSLCFPGVGGVSACPCSNPPNELGIGCNNSAATGGAVLSAFGTASLSTDTLVFTMGRGRPTATSIVMQGSSLIAPGAVFGQGIRCAAGLIKRLYVKTASGGSITAPEFQTGDLSVSVVSAAKGDPIQLGESRWYFVIYRDPVVLGGCGTSQTYNSTQTGRIDWSL